MLDRAQLYSKWLDPNGFDTMLSQLMSSNAFLEPDGGGFEMDMTPTEKAIRVLLKILARPYCFTRQRLAEDLSCDPTSITRAIKAIGAAGIEVEQEPPPYYRYFINTGQGAGDY